MAGQEVWTRSRENVVQLKVSNSSRGGRFSADRFTTMTQFYNGEKYVI